MSNSNDDSDSDAGSEVVPEIYFETVLVHKRRFQKLAVEKHIHFAPIDEKEIERLNYQHDIIKSMLNDRLVLPNLEDPREILDCGYGTAAWAMEVAEAYPQCNVTGIDISLHMKPEETPPNLWLEIDDLNNKLEFKDKSFDLVNSRFVAGGINAKRWPAYVRDIFRALRPGGWFQSIELSTEIRSGNNSLGELQSLAEWSERYAEALSLADTPKNPQSGQNMKQWMERAGFVEISMETKQFRLNSWGEDTPEAHIGERNRINVRWMLTSLGLYPLTEFIPLSMTEATVLLAHAAGDVNKTAAQPYFNMYVCQGRKPAQ